MTQAHIHDEPLAPRALLDDSPLSPEEELDLLFHASFEGELNAQERADFELRLERDPDFARAYEEFVTIMGGLRSLPFEFAPEDFVDKVQSRLRTRSRGRFFAEHYLYRSRVPYEVIAIVMIAIMAAAYLMMEPTTDKHLRDGDLRVGSPAPAASPPSTP